MFAFRLHKILAGQHELAGVPSKRWWNASSVGTGTRAAQPGGSEFQQKSPEVAGVLLGQGQQKPSPGLAENNYTDSRKHVKCLLQISGNVWRRVNAKELGSPTFAGQGLELPECGYSCRDDHISTQRPANPRPLGVPIATTVQWV